MQTAAEKIGISKTISIVYQIYYKIVICKAVRGVELSQKLYENQDK